MKQKFVVFSVNPSGVRVHLDVAREETPDKALTAIANIRKTSDIIIALTPTQLREIASNAEKLSEKDVVIKQTLATQEEATYQTGQHE